MFKLIFIAANLLFYVSHQVDLCAWNRAKSPEVGENIAKGITFINGDYDRDTTYTSGGQSQNYLGVPYYKMVIPGQCWATKLYLFRHTNFFDNPAVHTWVIGGAMGIDPEYGYAYCTAGSYEQNKPYGACDGKWMVGTPQDDAAGVLGTHEIDHEFYVVQGACPRVTCDSLSFSSTAQDKWMPDQSGNIFSGTFLKTNTPNVYKQIGNPASDNDAEGGTFFLFWNYRVWKWALNEFIDQYDNCELYKSNKGFTLVANIIPGAYINSVKDADGYWPFSTACTSCNRFIDCIGTIPTQTPTASTWTADPTPAPISFDWCNPNTDWTKVSPSAQATHDFYCGTPSPVANPRFTDDPSPSPIAPGSTPRPTDRPTPRPTPGPVVPPGSPSRTPTLKPTPAPVTPIPTPGPTVPKGSPSRDPTLKPTPAPGTGGGDGGGDGGSDDGSSMLNCNMYLLCIVVALCKLLF